MDNLIPFATSILLIGFAFSCLMIKYGVNRLAHHRVVTIIIGSAFILLCGWINIWMPINAINKLILYTVYFLSLTMVSINVGNLIVTIVLKNEK